MMLSISPKGGLAIAEVVFFAPALLVSAYVVFRHGFSRQLGWIYPIVLSLLRLVGASCSLYIDLHSPTSVGLHETVYITSAIGTAPLLLALLGFLTRINDGIADTRMKLHELLFRGVSLISLSALIIAIVGVNESSSGLMEAAAILFLALYMCCSGIAIVFFIRQRAIAFTEKKLVLGSLSSLPFLGVRILYTVIVSFKSKDSRSAFYYLDVNVYVSAFMQFLMEAVVMYIFVMVGLLTPRKFDVQSQGEARSGMQRSAGDHSMDFQGEQETLTE